MKEGDTLAVIHANSSEKLAEAEKRYLAACTFISTEPAKTPFIKEIIV